MRHTLKFTLWTIFLLWGYSIHAQSIAISQQKTLGGNDMDNQSSVAELNNDSYVMGGWSSSDSTGDKTAPNRGSNDGWVINISSDLNINWQQSYGGTQIDGVNTVITTQDGNFICGLQSDSPISGNKTASKIGGMDYWVIKLDASGNIIWQKTYGGNGNDYIRDILEFQDGSLLLSGTSYSEATGNKSDTSRGGSDYWIVKTDKNGNVQWDVTYGGASDDDLVSAAFIEDKHVVLYGHSRSDSSGEKSKNKYGSGVWEHDMWLLKIDTAGNIIWDKTVGSKGDEASGDVEVLDGSIYAVSYSNGGISGVKTSDSIGGFDYWVVKLDQNGTLIWDNTFGGKKSEFPSTIKSTSNGKLSVGGYSDSDSSGNKIEDSKGGSDYWVVTIDTNSQIDWQKTIGGSNDESLNSIINTSENNLLCVGDSKSGVTGDKNESNRGMFDYWVVELNIPVGIADPKEQQVKFDLYPNPFDQNIWIKPTTYKYQQYTTQIYNSQGQLVFQQSNSHSNQPQNINLKQLPKGLYIFEITTSQGKREVKKVVKH